LGFEDGVFSGAGRRGKTISSRAADKHFGAVNPGLRTCEKRGKTADVLTLGYSQDTPTEFQAEAETEDDQPSLGATARQGKKIGNAEIFFKLFLH
jgi:hypothetical protein